MSEVSYDFSVAEGGNRMAVFLIEKTLDYTVMSNRHLHSTRLALKRSN